MAVRICVPSNRNDTLIQSLYCPMADTSLIDKPCYMSKYTLKGMGAALVSKVPEVSLVVGLRKKNIDNVVIPMTKEQIDIIEASKNGKGARSHLRITFSSYQLAAARPIEGNSHIIHKDTQLVIPKKRVRKPRILPTTKRLLESKKRGRWAMSWRKTTNPDKVIMLTPANVSSLSDEYLSELHAMLTAEVTARVLYTSQPEESLGGTYCWSCQDYTVDYTAIGCSVCHCKKQ